MATLAARPLDSETLGAAMPEERHNATRPSVHDVVHLISSWRGSENLTTLSMTCRLAWHWRWRGFSPVRCCRHQSCRHALPSSNQRYALAQCRNFLSKPVAQTMMKLPRTQRTAEIMASHLVSQTARLTQQQCTFCTCVTASLGPATKANVAIRLGQRWHHSWSTA